MLCFLALRCLMSSQMLRTFLSAPNAAACEGEGREGWGELGVLIEPPPATVALPWACIPRHGEAGLAAAFALPWDPVGSPFCSASLVPPHAELVLLSCQEQGRCGVAAGSAEPPPGSSPPSPSQSSSPSSSQPDAQLLAGGLGSSLPVPPMLGVGTGRALWGAHASILCPKALQKVCPREPPQSRTGWCGGTLRGLTEP